MVRVWKLINLLLYNVVNSMYVFLEFLIYIVFGNDGEELFLKFRFYFLLELYFDFCSFYIILFVVLYLFL